MLLARENTAALSFPCNQHCADVDQSYTIHGLLQQALNEVLSNPDGDASPFIPMLQQQTPQLGDFRRVYPSCDTAAAAAAGAAGSSGSITAATCGRQQSGLLGDEQARGFLWRAGNRALLGVLASIFRDVQVQLC
jgi:hypothetical protein